MSGILVVVEERAGRISRIGWEAVAAGQRLGAQLGLPVSAAVLGAQTESLAAAISSTPLAKVVRVEHPLLTPYTADSFTLALQQLIEKECCAQVVLPHTYLVRDYAPALAARFGQVLIGDVIAIGDGPVFTRQLLRGRLNGSYRHTGSGPCLISVQAGAFRADPVLYQGTTSVMPKSRQNEGGALAPVGNSPAPISIFTPILNADQIRTRPGEPWRAGAQTVDLGSAQRIVSVGRGIKEAENIPIVQELATALGAELAAGLEINPVLWRSGQLRAQRRGQLLNDRNVLCLFNAPSYADNPLSRTQVDGLRPGPPGLAGTGANLVCIEDGSEDRDGRRRIAHRG